VSVAAVEAAPAAVGARTAATRPLPSPRPERPRQPARGPAGQPGPRGRPGGTSRSRPRRSVRSTLGAGPGRGIKSSNYQGVILAEFVAAILLVALTPIAANQKQQTQSGGLSPYAGQDMIKLAAITVVYLILALLSVRPGPGRFAAWFGGLILLAVGLNEAAHLAQVLDIFGGAETAASSAASKAKAGVTQVGDTIAGRG